MGEQTKKVGQLEDDLNRADAEIARLKQALDDLRATQLVVEHLRSQVQEAEGRGYERFKGHLLKAIPRFDSAMN